jgi:hypothetical protein
MRIQGDSESAAAGPASPRRPGRGAAAESGPRPERRCGDHRRYRASDPGARGRAVTASATPGRSRCPASAERRAESESQWAIYPSRSLPVPPQRRGGGPPPGPVTPAESVALIRHDVRLGLGVQPRLSPGPASEGLTGRPPTQCESDSSLSRWPRDSGDVRPARRRPAG